MRKMNTFKLGFLQVWHRRSRLFIQWLMVVLGLGLISGFITLQASANRQLEKDLGSIDLVWCAKGSPLRGLLANVYHIDNPSGNISLDEVEQYARNPMVAEVTRIAYGDVYRAKRILGADSSWRDLYALELAEGDWNAKPMEVVLSSSLAEQLELSIGDVFHGQHGAEEAAEEHHEDYKVVGIYKNTGTVADRVLLTQIQSVWDVHHVDAENLEITAALVRTNSPMALFQLPRAINQNSTFQAVMPSIEVSRVYELLSSSEQVFFALSILFLILGGLSITITLYETLRAQQFDHTLLRVFGLSLWRLALLIWTQTILLMVSAWLVGIGLIKALLYFSRDAILNAQGFYVEFNGIDTIDLLLLGVAVVSGILIAFPAVVRIFGSSIHQNLKNA
ncbi:MAG: ABC transporter permease [Flavobacteriia bacterium]|nr:ABC transporter permease [Flavobacteriia bacterium]